MRNFIGILLCIIVVIGFLYLRNKNDVDKWINNKNKQEIFKEENAVIEPNGNINVKALSFDKEKAKTAIIRWLKQEIPSLNNIESIHFSDTDLKNVKEATVSINNNIITYHFIVRNEPLLGYTISNTHIVNREEEERAKRKQQYQNNIANYVYVEKRFSHQDNGGNSNYDIYIINKTDYTIDEIMYQYRTGILKKEDFSPEILTKRINYMKGNSEIFITSTLESIQGANITSIKCSALGLN